MFPFEESLLPSAKEHSARFQDTLIEAVQAEELTDVRRILKAIPEHLRKATLLLPSVKMEHKLQTPLMAGAATGNISIVGKNEKPCLRKTLAGSLGLPTLLHEDDIARTMYCQPRSQLERDRSPSR